MSFLDGLIDDAVALIAPSFRSIGGIIPDCVIEERHFDRLNITEHPVETGAAITDHSFRNPSAVVMKIGFSNSTAASEGWVQAAYQMLLQLMQARQPFDVFTGKRPYSNMLVDTLEVETDVTSEYALNCTAALREIIIVSTQQSGASSPASAQSAPDQTSTVQDAGTQQINPATGAPSFAETSTITSGAGGTFNTIGQGSFPTTVAGGFSPPAASPYGPN